MSESDGDPDPVYLVALSRDQWLDVLSGLDARLYEDAPQTWRSSGGVLDPRLSTSGIEDEDDQALCDAIDAHDAIESAILAAIGPDPKVTP